MNALSPAKRQPIPFGKYLLLDRVNIGGMAEVWRGKSLTAAGFERLVAIKRILPNIAEDEEFIAMFIDEAKITVQLSHANVAQIYELGHIQGNYFIAMEYIPGKDMRAIFDRCRKKGEPAPIPLTCYVIAKLCEGLDYAHRRKDSQGREMNIVHRDVSPQNVLVSYEGEVKVIDFGIAKAVGKATKTQAGILKGKFGYMSPEQVRGVPIDRRSDIFAVGVCLHEMLTGERLFVGESDFSVLEKVRKAQVSPPSGMNAQVPEELERIVLKALAGEVADRYQHASELADDLQRFLITSDAVFSRKDLMQFMKATFAEEVERERQRLADYAELKPPPLAPDTGTALTAAPPSDPAAGSAGEPVPTNPTEPRAPAPAEPVTDDLSETLDPAVAVRRPSPVANLPRMTSPEMREARDSTLVEGRGYFDEAKEPKTQGGGTEAPSPERAVAPELTSSDPASSDLSATIIRPPEMLDAKAGLPNGRRPSLPPARSDRPEEASGWGAHARELLLGGAALALVALAAVLYLLLRPPPEGFLRVNFSPELSGQNVRVNLDGTYYEEGKDFDVRRGPLLKRVRAGETLVLVTADGFEEYQQQVVVRPGNEPTVLQAKLQRSVRLAQLWVPPQPEDVSLKVGGEAVERAEGGGFEVEVPVGKEVVVELSRPGFEPYAKKLIPRREGERIRLAPTLKPQELTVTVTSTPTGASILVDGRPLGQQTPATIRVPPETTKVVLTKRCHDPTEVRLRQAAHAGEPVLVSGALRRRPNCR